LLERVARTDVERAACGADLFVSVLRALPPERRRNALRYWISRSGARLPDTTRLEALAASMLDARVDANPRVTWGDVEVQRHADLLSIRQVAAVQTACSLEIAWFWPATPVLQLPDGGGTLELKEDAHGPIDLDVLPPNLTVRRREGGERLRP